MGHNVKRHDMGKLDQILIKDLKIESARWSRILKLCSAKLPLALPEKLPFIFMFSLPLRWILPLRLVTDLTEL